MSTTTTDVRNLCREYSCTISSGIGQKKVSQDHILLFVWKVVSATGWPFHSELRFGVNPEIENSGQNLVVQVVDPKVIGEKYVIK